jgi:uncharacterized protein YecE (DUF72 family)
MPERSELSSGLIVTDAMAKGRIHVGTTGFNYPDWLGNFYPQFCPPADFLRCYSNVFSTVELDSTFYRIPDVETVEKWARSTSGDFRFSARVPQSVTHEGTLDSRIAAATGFIEVMRSLGDKSGPLLMQFPAGFGLECQPVLKELLKQLPRDIRIAVEFRRSDWFNPATFRLLKKHGVALCLAECPGLPRLRVRTAEFGYIRLVGDRNGITEDFSHVRQSRTEELDYWAGAARELSEQTVEIYAYLSNHFSGHAPTTARQFRELLQGNGSGCG